MGAKVYVVQTCGPGGVTRCTTIGSYLWIGAERARVRAQVVINLTKQELNPAPRPELTVVDLAERYLDVHVAVNCGPSTQKAFRRLVDKYILTELGDLQVTAVDRFHVVAQLGHLPKRGGESSKAWLYGKLFSALLTEKLIAHASALSPWGYDFGAMRSSPEQVA